jgi:hypothetical protein
LCYAGPGESGGPCHIYDVPMSENFSAIICGYS